MNDQDYYTFKPTQKGSANKAGGNGGHIELGQIDTETEESARQSTDGGLEIVLTDHEEDDYDVSMTVPRARTLLS